MNYYKARQRKDGRWDYTCMNDGHILPVGYCSPYREPNGEWYWNQNSIKKYQAEKEFHHEDGHATEDEACECYRKYLLDTTLLLGHCSASTQHKCRVCDKWTNRYATVDGGHIYNLCEEHNNRVEVEKLFEAPGEIWSS